MLEGIATADPIADTDEEKRLREVIRSGDPDKFKAVLDEVDQFITPEGKARVSMVAINHAYFEIFKILLIYESNEMTKLSKGELLRRSTVLCNEAFKLGNDPKFDIHLMLLGENPSLEKLALQNVPTLIKMATYKINFKSLPERPNLKNLQQYQTLIPLLIKDPSNKIWLYGKDKYDREILTHLGSGETDKRYHFLMGKIASTGFEANQLPAAIFTDIALKQAHVNQEIWCLGWGVNNQKKLIKLPYSPLLGELPFGQAASVEKSKVPNKIFEMLAASKAHYLPSYFYQIYLKMVGFLLETEGENLPQSDIAFCVDVSQKAKNQVLCARLQAYVKENKEVQAPQLIRDFDLLFQHIQCGTLEEVQTALKDFEFKDVDEKRQACQVAFHRANPNIFAAVFKKNSPDILPASKLFFFYEAVLLVCKWRDNYLSIIECLLKDIYCPLKSTHKGWALLMAARNSNLELLKVILMEVGALPSSSDLVYALENVRGAQAQEFIQAIHKYANSKGMVLVSPLSEVSVVSVVPDLLRASLFDELIAKMAALKIEGSTFYALVKSGSLQDVQQYLHRSSCTITPHACVHGIIIAIENDHREIVDCLLKDFIKRHAVDEDDYLNYLSEMLLVAAKKNNPVYAKLLLDRVHPASGYRVMARILPDVARVDCSNFIRFLVDSMEQFKLNEARACGDLKLAQSTLEGYKTRLQLAQCEAIKSEQLFIVPYLMEKEISAFFCWCLYSCQQGMKLIQAVKERQNIIVAALLREINSFHVLHLEMVLQIAVL